MIMTTTMIKSRWNPNTERTTAEGNLELRYKEEQEDAENEEEELEEKQTEWRKSISSTNSLRTFSSSVFHCSLTSIWCS